MWDAAMPDRFGLGIWKNNATERKPSPGTDAQVESQSLQGSKSRVDVALGGLGSAGNGRIQWSERAFPISVILILFFYLGGKS